MRQRSSIARPSQRMCVVSQRLCVERSLPSQIICAENGHLLRVGSFIIARRYSYAPPAIPAFSDPVSRRPLFELPESGERITSKHVGRLLRRETDIPDRLGRRLNGAGRFHVARPRRWSDDDGWIPHRSIRAMGRFRIDGHHVSCPMTATFLSNDSCLSGVANESGGAFRGL